MKAASKFGAAFFSPPGQINMSARYGKHRSSLSDGAPGQWPEDYERPQKYSYLRYRGSRYCCKRSDKPHYRKRCRR